MYAIFYYRDFGGKWTIRVQNTKTYEYVETKEYDLPSNLIDIIVKSFVDAYPNSYACEVKY